MQDARMQSAIERQDETLEMLGSGVQRVKALAGTMRDELHDQAVILDNLDDDMDRTETSMNSMSKKLNSLMTAAKSSERGQWAMIACLLLTLGVLVLTVLDG